MGSALTALALNPWATPAASIEPSPDPPPAPVLAQAAEELPPLKSHAALAEAAEPARPVTADRPRGFATASVRPGRSVALRSKPSGPPLTRLGDRTQFGSRQTLSVVARKGRWLGVTTAARPNGRLGWIDARHSALRTDRTLVSLHADLSERTLELRRGKRVADRLPVAVGRPGSTTPTGRFAVTDKLDGTAYSGYFGCCILPISGTQPNLPPGWPGGNRLAIHGTSSPQTVGRAASAGCLRAGERSMRRLMRRVPTGTPVFIKR